MDEPASALDPIATAVIEELIDELKEKYTIAIVTHSMQQALAHGTRTVMLHQGQVVLDVAGDIRKGMTVHDLLDMFEQTRGEKVEDDSLILS